MTKFQFLLLQVRFVPISYRTARAAFPQAPEGAPAFAIPDAIRSAEEQIAAGRYVTIRMFICFCFPQIDSQCESQKLNSRGNINNQSHLSHKCHDANHVDVCWNTFKTLHY